MREKNKIKRKISFNVFDVFVILLVVILIGSVIYKISVDNSKEARKDNSTYTIVFECYNEYNSLSKYVSDGDEVYIKAGGELLGYIYKSADSKGAQSIHVIEKDTEQTTEKKSPSKLYERVDYEGKIKLNGNAEKSRDGLYYTVEGMNVTVGSKIEVYTKNAQFTITVKEFITRD